MPPVIIAAAISAAAAIGGASMQSNAAQNAANTQAGAAQNAIDQQNKMYQQTRSDLNPYMQGGTAALGKLASQDPFKFQFSQSDPSYQFRFQQGQNALNQSAAAGGGFFSTGTGQNLINYGQQAASQEYGNEYNRSLGTYQTNTNNLQYLASLGENAASGAGNAGMTAAGNIGGYMTNAGNAQAGAQVAGGNAWSGAVTNLANNAQSTIMLQQLLQQYQNGGNGAIDPNTASPMWQNNNAAIDNMGNSGWNWGG